MNCREIDLHFYIARYFKHKSFTFQEEEFYFYERKIDVLAYSQKNELVVAVEAKLADWKKAFRQASLYQLCSDFVYVAMPRSKFESINREQFKERGIGFLAIYESGRCQELINPSRHTGLRSYHRDSIIKRIGASA